MKPQDIRNFFNFTFEKTSDEVKTAANKKIEFLRAKIQERETRVSKLRSEYGIDDSALAQLLIAARRHQQNENFSNSYTYNSSVREGLENRLEERTIGAGVVNNLLTENDFIESEKASVKRLELIVRNLRPLSRYSEDDGLRYSTDAFLLSYSELEFLNF